MTAQKRFYVYQFSDEQGIVYIGKGSGRRIEAQRKKYQCYGEVIEWHEDEGAAYKAERRLIAERKPRLNKHAGGNGSRAQKLRKRQFAWEREINRIGSRAYAAKLVLSCERQKAGSVDPSKVDAIRQVANGCW